MNKIIILLLFVIGGCSSSTNDNSTQQEVNLLGVWDYQITSQNHACAGLIAKGIWTNHSLNGDTSIIGDVLIQGEVFADDGSGNCFYRTVDITLTTSIGSPSTVTLAMYQDNLNIKRANNNAVVSEIITSFSSAKIVFETEAANGIILTTTLTR